MANQGKHSMRGHVFHELTRSLCPTCRKLIDAQVLIRDGGVYLRKRCPEHGWSEALVSSDAEWYLSSLKYNEPGQLPCDFTTEVTLGCPYDCGLCPEHQQHTCVALIEITTRCNQNCLTCFANAGTGYDLSLAQVESMLDRLIETEGQPEIVQISGGEPLLHPQILDVVGALKSRNIRHIMVNTSGVRLAKERDFVQELARYRPTIYLQFDGLNDSVYQAIRGLDLTEIKEQALNNIAGAGLKAVLVSTVVRGINEDQIGEVLRYGIRHPAVIGVSYQPATYAGRFIGYQDPLSRTTLPDVLHAIEEQTEGMFQLSDFLPVPCPHPVCSASTYAFVDGDEVVPLSRLVNPEDYLDLAVNRSLPDFSAELESMMEGMPDLTTALSALVGNQEVPSSTTCCPACTLPDNLELNSLRDHFFMIHAHGFMDEYTFDLKRLMKCCIHQLLPDGRVIPFCAYNVLGYREETKREQEMRNA